MRARVRDAGLEAAVEIESAGTGDWHAGHPPDARATAAAAERGVALAGTARTVDSGDFERFDRIIAMDSQNLADLERLAAGSGGRAKLSRLRDHDPLAVESGDVDVPDPYYGGEDGFEHVLDVVERGCDGLLGELGDGLSPR